MDINKIIKENKNIPSKHEKVITNFVDEVIEHSSVDDSKLVENIETLKIDESIFSKLKLILINEKVKYIPSTNTILLNTDDVKEIQMELMNVRSVNEYNDFELYPKFNRGVTEYLTNKYFDNKNNEYSVESLVAYILDKVLGNGVLERCYINASIEELIAEINSATYQVKDKIEQIFINFENLSEQDDINIYLSVLDEYKCLIANIYQLKYADFDTFDDIEELFVIIEQRIKLLFKVEENDCDDIEVNFKEEIY